MAEIISMPKLGFDMADGTLLRWVVSEDEEVEKGQILAEIETDKATVEVESTYSGVVRRHLVEEGAIVPVSTPIAVIGEAAEEIDFEQLVGESSEQVLPTEAGKEADIDAAAETSAETEKIVVLDGDVRLPDDVRASPLARRMAEELGLDLRKIRGSGPGGRIIKADIEADQEAAPVGVEPQFTAPPIITGEVPADRHVPLSRLRAAIGKRMTQSKQEYPQFFITHEYDVGRLIDIRKQFNSILPEEEKTSVNDYIIKATAMALREFPNLNAKLDPDNQAVIQFGHVNIGVAVAVENGLLTVVCQDADLKSVRHIAMEVKSMASRARGGKVRPEDIEGSTFSISNLGMFSVEEFIAIINPPEAAILAVGSANQVAVVKDGDIIPGWRMKATISVDHRVSDGAEAARFMQALATYLEEPLRLML
jgi:pyruvate dehydrogenase E2 component (dihydrolipoamide acetyltransferase)